MNDDMAAETFGWIGRQWTRMPEKAGGGASTLRSRYPAVACSSLSMTPPAYIMKLPKAEQDIDEWQATIERLIVVPEQNGPNMMARIGMFRALNRNVVREFDSSRKDTHRGRR
jgi:hypothetical protein